MKKKFSGQKELPSTFEENVHWIEIMEGKASGSIPEKRAGHPDGKET